MLEQLAYAEETIHARAPVPLNVIGMNNIAPAIMQYGTDAQKRELLPRMVRADDIWCQGMSEPEAGSDLASLRTRAVLDGDEYVVNGQKIWTSLGHRADWCQLYVRTDPDAPKHKGISCLIVDMTLPGIEVRPLVTLNGASRFRGGVLQRRAGARRRSIGPVERRVAGGHYHAEPRTGGRGAAVCAAGGAIAGSGGRPRRLSGRRNGPCSRTARRCDALARWRCAIKYLEVLCQRSISATLHGGDALGSASLAKSVWAELGQELAALAFDVLGPLGGHRRWTEYRLTSRSLTIAGGTTQINKSVTATRVLGLPRPMNLELTDEQLALRDTVRRFLAEKASLPTHVRPMLDDPTGTTAEVWDGLASLGATGVLVPQEHGGSGMTMVEAGVVAEELGAALHPGPWLSSAVVATRALTRAWYRGGCRAAC